MADDRNGLGLLEERTDEGDGVLVRPKPVGVAYAAGQNQPVVVVRGGVLDRPIDGERGRLVEVVTALHLAALERD